MSIELNKLIIELTVSDVRKSLEFYTQIMGFETTFVTPSGEYAVIRLYENEIRLRKKPERWLHEFFGELEVPFGRGLSFRIELGDLTSLLQRLEHAGLRPIVEPREIETATLENSTKVLAVDVMDPDGYVFFCRQEISHGYVS